MYCPRWSAPQEVVGLLHVETAMLQTQVWVSLVNGGAYFGVVFIVIRMSINMDKFHVSNGI